MDIADTDTPESLYRWAHVVETGLVKTKEACKALEDELSNRGCDEAALEMERAYNHIDDALSIYQGHLHETEQNSD